MAVNASAEVRQLTPLELMGHLFRRAGFGATRDELEAALAKGYEATLEELLHPERAPDLEEDLLFRSFPDFHESRKVDVAVAAWVWRMIHTQRPLEEKMLLFWHCLFATGNAKVESPLQMASQIATLRHVALSDFRTILLEPGPEAIDYLAAVYHKSQYDIRAMLRALFMSPFFRSERAYYAKVKSPAEHVVGIMRLVGDDASPQPGFGEISLECRYMGQDLLNPPSVEGWHMGKEWIDTGCLVERVNFGAKQLGDVSKPGVQWLSQLTPSPHGSIGARIRLGGACETLFPTSSPVSSHEGGRDITPLTVLLGASPGTYVRGGEDTGEGDGGA